MGTTLLLLLVVIPLVELALLVELGRQTSTLVAVGWVVTSGIIGWWLCKSQGIQTYRRIRREAAAGQLPAAALIDGLLILIAGALLMTPGILTDLLGISLLVPGSRALFRNMLLKKVRRHVEAAVYTRPNEAPDPDGDILEGEVVAHNDEG